MNIRNHILLGSALASLATLAPENEGTGGQSQTGADAGGPDLPKSLDRTGEQVPGSERPRVSEASDTNQPQPATPPANPNPNPAPKPGPKAKGASGKGKAPAKAPESQRRAPASIGMDDQIKLLVEGNPKKRTAAERFKFYAECKTVKDYCRKVTKWGGNDKLALRDIAWDMKQKWIKLEAPRKAAA
jgi:hypothetical protein